jgi:tetratricopeptide (TPR) repeat protein
LYGDGTSATKSVEALQAFTLGQKTLGEQGSAAALPFFKRAIELDPDFALAYNMVAGMYGNTGESTLAIEYTKRAYALRDRVTEREKLALEMSEVYFVSGDLSRYAETLALYKRTYPRENGVWVVSSGYKDQTGDFEGAISDAQHALTIEPTDSIATGNLAAAYIALNRFGEAKAALDRAVTNGVDPTTFAPNYYILAFLNNDAASMQKQFSLVMAKGDDDGMLSIQSFTEAFYGHVKKAREYSQRAVDAARRDGSSEGVALNILNGAIREGEFGYFLEAQRGADAVVRLTPTSRIVRAMLAMTFARTRSTQRAQRIQDALAKEFPRDTSINVCWLPLIRAAIELNQSNPGKAVELLRTAQERELGCPMGMPYLRGYALLAAGQGMEAVGEFQKLLDRRGIVLNTPFAPLAHLGLGRAFVAAGDREKARIAYRDFLELWKDADPDIPILKQAKAEYAKLQ